MVMSSPACSEANEPDADAETSLSVLLIIHLDTYTAASVSNGTTTSKSKTKETKSTKVKDITLMLLASNYLDFFTTMLAKHGKDKYKVTEKKTYSFKYLLPSVKVHNDAMDVDNAGDFVDMAKKILASKPSKVKVFIDMKEVEKLPLRGKRRAGDHDDGSKDEGHHNRDQDDSSCHSFGDAPDPSDNGNGGDNDPNPNPHNHDNNNPFDDDPNNAMSSNPIMALADEMQSVASLIWEPDTFDETDPCKLQAFLVQCELNFQDRPCAFRTDHAKVTFTQSYLKGMALKWLEPDLLQMDDPDFHPDWMDDYRESVLELQTNFGPHDPVGA
ncbi:hypothetical protein BS17DRAFT_880589 [Gyrodon lividus]|nr:hypothetical protein BS17DRAFT_880589 [Gyrodon lividus]